MKPIEVIKNAGINALDVSLGDFMTNIVSQSEKSTEPVEMALNVKINVLYKDKAWEVATSSNFVEKYKGEHYEVSESELLTEICRIIENVKGELK